ncbi:MAG: hypothetical protein NVSMB1_03030 [Polyangiales bacterium]
MTSRSSRGGGVTSREPREFSLEVSTRSCIGCGERGDALDMIRLVLIESPDGSCSIAPDAKGGAFGRGAHVHPCRECLERGCQRGLSRAFRRDLRADPVALASTIARAFDRRLCGLISGGVRGGLLAVGTDAVADALRAGRAHLILLAADATAAAERTAVQQATERGIVLVYGDKLQLARAIGRAPLETRDGVAVLAVTDMALAAAIRRAWLCAVGLVPAVVRADSPQGVTRLSEDE